MHPLSISAQYLILLWRSKSDVQRAVFRFAQKTPFKEIYRGERVFESEKSSIFLIQKHARP
jgi:hypothetical protein